MMHRAYKAELFQDILHILDKGSPSLAVWEKISGVMDFIFKFKCNSWQNQEVIAVAKSFQPAEARITDQNGFTLQREKSSGCLCSWLETQGKEGKVFES